MNKPVVIFTTPILAHPPVGGPRLRIANSIKALSQIAELVIHSRTSLKNVGGESAVQFFKLYCKEFIFSEAKSGREEYEEVIALAQKHGANIIWLGYGNISYGLAIRLKLFSKYKVVIDTDSVWSRFVLRGIPYKKSLSEKFKAVYLGVKKRAEEMLGAMLADMTTAVSEIDAKYYRRFSNNVAVFSNVIDLKQYTNILKYVGMIHPAIYFSGSFGPGSAMEYGATWLLRDVMPRVWEKNAEVNVYLVGRGNTDNLKQHGDRRVIITGEVPDTLPYLAAADAAVVPLWYESGTRFKILEAAACRVPIVSTTLGAEGLPAVNGKNALIADDAESFAIHILNVLARPDLRVQLTEHAFTDFAENFDISRAVREAQNILIKLV